MLAFTCPSCGAPIEFRSSVSVYAVCRSCGSTVVRSDAGVAAIGHMASLPDDVSPLQLGTELTWDGHTYTVLGRVRVAWEDGGWNEWFVSAGERQGWLAEAQGALSIAFEAPVPAELAGALPALGAQFVLNGQAFTVADIKQAMCAGSEGELPFAAPRGRGFTDIDLIGARGGFAGLEDSAEGRRFHLGQYAPFDAFRFRNLRRLDGWTPPVAGRQDDPAFL